jgi:hypothetical protein
MDHSDILLGLRKCLAKASSASRTPSGGAILDMLKHVKKALDSRERFRRHADPDGEAPLQLPPTETPMEREAADIVRTLGNRDAAHGLAPPAGLRRCEPG